MKNLLERHGANTSSPLKCAVEHGCTERKTSECGCEARTFRPEVRQRKRLWFAVGQHRQEAQGLRCSGACLPRVIPSVFGHCFGAYATPGGRLVLLLRLAPPPVTASIEILFGKSAEKIYDGPTVNAELRPWESRPLARLRRV